jgi:NAD(P)-dependent dehydrogenase (short-subunit alcohol dehydrogenase family)
MTAAPRCPGGTALVTGAAHGIGAAVARMLHAEGAVVVIADVDTDAGSVLAAELGERASSVHLDVTLEDSWAAAVSGLDSLSILVNCAGAALRRPLLETSPEDFRRIVDLNLVGTFLGLRVAGARLGPGGTIVNVSSLNGVLPTAGLGAYVSSKAGVSALTRVAALELAERGVRVNAVCPGSIDTAITDSPDFAGVDWEAYLRAIPLRRRGTPEDVARAVLYLASEESAYVTGENLVIDGGIAAGRQAP